jgi:tripartite-type tricarboxylate transporter receptor subunit TctC
MKTTRLHKILPAALGFAAAGMLAGPAMAEQFPSKPIELICSTSPGSGAANWCHMVAENLQKKEFLGVPVKVLFKSGGSNHEPVVYVQNKPADGYTLLHISASFTGYFNLPHFKFGPQDFDMLARMEQHIYALAVRSDSPFKTYKDVIAYAKANPNKLSLGSNKIGSIHHRHQELLHQTQGLKIRFVPYKGTGDVVKDVMGGHLKIGMAQPGKWARHFKAGKARVVLLLNEKHMDDPLFKDVPVPSDLGIKYKIPHQFQGFMVKKGTPKDRMAVLQKALAKISTVTAYKKYIKKQPHVIPAYDGNTEELNKEMAEGTKATRQLMVQLGILKK